MQIKDLYAGKPDAGDEIDETGYEEFAKYYIEPSKVDIPALESTNFGTPIFVMGDKGTGKTALLHFLEYHIHQRIPYACISKISFQKDYSQVARNQLHGIAKSISSTFEIEESIAGGERETPCDFTYIWRWKFYDKLINDDEEFNYGLFERNTAWDKFVSQISKIGRSADKRHIVMPKKLTLGIKVDVASGIPIPELGLDFSEKDFGDSTEYARFVSLMEEADELVKNIRRTDTPYFLFIDELEAFRAENKNFYRDLRMIRDLLETVKRLNGIFKSGAETNADAEIKSGTKIICFVRPEIINAINRFVEPEEFHKTAGGYESKLVWEHTNTNSFSHPIMQMLIKRIQIAEEKNANQPIGDVDSLIDRWFSKLVNNQNVCEYILNHTWHKPRDVVRLLLSAQASGAKAETRFTQKTFDMFMPEYSKRCLQETREELRALYSSAEVEDIIECFRGYRVAFTFEELRAHINDVKPNSLFSKDMLKALNDLYRVGFLGNQAGNSKQTQWAYKGYESLLTNLPWKIVVHPALHNALSINRRIDNQVKRALKSKNSNASAQSYQATVESEKPFYLILSFEKDGQTVAGYLPKWRLGQRQVQEGDTLNVEILSKNPYNSQYGTWNLDVV